MHQHREGNLKEPVSLPANAKSSVHGKVIDIATALPVAVEERCQPLPQTTQQPTTTPQPSLAEDCSTDRDEENSDDWDGEDFEHLAQNGDEENYRMKDGVIEMLTRSDEQIGEAEAFYLAKVWYHRCYLRNIEEYEQGLTPQIAGEAAAERYRQEYGEENLEGPYTDFEWGMINGKLSALRWVSGHEWDFLDA